MKKIIALTVLLALSLVYTYHGQAVEPVSSEAVPQIFFVDRKLHRLISLDFAESGNPEALCRKMIAELIDGRDNNPEILRIIPKEKHIISVKVKNQSAIVDLSSRLKQKIAKNPENERLVIYQIVNSLTSVSGISQVQFTIDRKVEKDFLGFLDMREIFTPNYDI